MQKEISVHTRETAQKQYPCLFGREFKLLCRNAEYAPNRTPVLLGARLAHFERYLH